MADQQAWPTVTVVVPTHDRPLLLARTLEAIENQDYPGHVETLVVFDRAEPDTQLERPGPRPVRVLRNDRTPGLAGARNVGILGSREQLVAFCDDDDWWTPTKLRRQVERWLADGRPPLVTTAIMVDFDGTLSPRTAGTTLVTLGHLTRSRMAMLHSSTLLFDRVALTERVGLVDETIPGSQNEDWDILLRAAKVAPIHHVDDPLVVVSWTRNASFFARAWDTKISSLEWMLAQHPEIAEDRRGVARVYGQIAFGTASLRRRRTAFRWAARALVRDPLQWRAAVAVVVALRVVRPDAVLNALHRFGRGV